MRNKDRLRAALGYEFREEGLLTAALTHSSYVNEHAQAESYERLEFLGDKVLGLIVAERLYRERRTDAGDLTQALKKLVSEEPLTEAFAAAGLTDGDIRWGKGGPHGDKVRSDVYEALVAALLLDGGYGAAKAFAERTLLGRYDIENMDVTPRGQGDYVSELNERGKPEFSYSEEQGGRFVAKAYLNGAFVGEGSGKNKKEARQAAAKAALAGGGESDKRGVK